MATVTPELREPVLVRSQQRRALWLISAAELLAMTLWFTGTTVLPQLAAEWHVSLGFAAWLTNAVQFGFVTGALLIAVFSLADVFHPVRVFAISAVGAAVANALFPIIATRSIFWSLLLRFITGMFLAGVYPVGMKLMATWFREGRGLALGILVGALTVGKATPHALYAAQQALATTFPWRAVVWAGSVLALMAAAIVALGVREGPLLARSARFNLAQTAEILRNRRLRLANLGYFGHMWELYSMWSWIAIMLAAAGNGAERTTIETASFFAISLGAVGCIWAGARADRAEPASRIAARANVTIVAMAVSGVCCLLAAVVFPVFPLLVAVALVWGVAVVADSAQFSAIITEVADQRYVGTALTLQTALGFLLTTVSIRATAAISATRFGWRGAAAMLAIGPALGILAMLRLRSKAGSMATA
jgi:MFS family permease